ncbi:MAG: DUF2163 domain-containing protein [Waterburya sp.]
MLTFDSLAVCRCWKITTRENVVFNITSLDRPIIYNNETYSPIQGFNPASIARNAELAVDNSELESIFGSESNEIKVSDVIGGKLDGATIEQYLVNWVTGEKFCTQLSGTVGEIKHSDRIFSVEMRSLAEYLNTPNKLTVTAKCPLQFGSVGFGQCNATAPDQLETEIYSIFNVNNKFRITLDRTPETETDDYFMGFNIELYEENGGALLWKGHIVRYLDPDSQYATPTTVIPAITINQTLPFQPDGGMGVVIKANCNKSLEACIKFNNLANFKGWHNLVPTKERLNKQFR